MIPRATSTAFSSISEPLIRGFFPRQFIKKRVFATTSLVKHEREIPEVVHWYMADRLFEPTARLNDLLGGQVSTWVEEMREIRGRTRLNWRILREVNRTILSVPENCAYEVYRGFRDVRMWARWRQLEKAFVCGDRPRT